MLTRVALVADTHGEIDARIVRLVAGCDIVVHSGDIGGIQVLARLQPRAGRVYAVRGNNDRRQVWPVHEHEMLAWIPSSVSIELPAGALVAVHGHRLAAHHRHESLRQMYPSARAIVYGHSHRLVIDCDRVPWVLNPGAAARTQAHGMPSCLVLIATDTIWQLETHRFAAPRTPRRVTQQMPDRARKTIG